MKNSALGKAKWSVLAMVASLLLLIALPAKGAVLLYAFMFYLCTFIALIALHIFLGKAASQSGRSWVYFGLLPVLWPAMGGIISYLILSRKVKNENP